MDAMDMMLVGKVIGKTEDGKAIVEVGQDVDVFTIEDGAKFITLMVNSGGYLALFGTEESDD